jgi:5'-nucleotidase/UDP-sugar diphosphatase
MKPRTIVFLLFAVFTLLSGCNEVQATPAQNTFTVLYTNDEHGWISGVQEDKGAANLAGLWSEEGYYDDEKLLILSGGDNWVGPAVSTWHKGESTVEVMNAIGYDAVAVGNHEFDFGMEVFGDRIAQAEFPYLSANMRYRSTGQVPVDLGILPYTIIKLDDLNIGIIGLTTVQTPAVTNPEYISDFEFLPYRETLEEFIPLMRQEGAGAILVIAHICSDELTRLAWQLKSQDIIFMGGGHCHEFFTRRIAGAVLMSAGSKLEGYGLARFEYNPKTGQTRPIDYAIQINTNGHSKKDIASIINRWESKTKAELGEAIGYLEEEIPRRSRLMEGLITNTWLECYPAADASITNRGGIRDGLPSGEITREHIISVLPFDDTLVAVELTGDQLIHVLERGKNPAYSGVESAERGWFMTITGEPVVGDKIYTVLVNDFMYAGGDGYEELAEFDPDAVFTSTGWREPLIEWIKSQHSSQQNPLDPAVNRLVQ